MFFVIIVVLIVVYFNGGGIVGISFVMEVKNIFLNVFKYVKVLSLLVIILGLGWGLGYFG